MPSTPLKAPGWLEIAAALICYLILVVFLGLWLAEMSDAQAAIRGIVAMAANGLAGFLALLTACALRIRDLRAFGFRPASRHWLLAAAAMGVAAVGISILIEQVYFHFVTEPNTQGDFQAAAQSGIASLLVLIFAGAVLTPLGEEFVFRGVIANALNRYGAWSGVLGSATIFAVAHGPSVILLNAFLVGLLAAFAFRRTGSLWPGVVIHVVFNGLWLLIYSLQPAPASLAALILAALGAST